jgi:hypothetical protein
VSHTRVSQPVPPIRQELRSNDFGREKMKNNFKNLKLGPL